MFVELKSFGEVRVRELSLEGFIAWLEKQPIDGEYSYYSYKTCAIGLYLHSMGTSRKELGIVGRETSAMLILWNTYITLPYPWTFGAALARAKALMP